MRELRLIRRQICGSLRQSTIFVLCVVLSMVTLVSLGSFSRSVHLSLLQDGRTLHAADIIITAKAPFSGSLLALIDNLKQKNEIKTATIHNFYSVARTVTNEGTNGEASLLADIKVVEQGYPFYGMVKLASGGLFHEALSSGSVIVEQTLLDRLHLRIGDRLGIGSAILTISDVVLEEPDRPVNFFALGPRIFVAAVDLPSLGLVGKGSRVSYTILSKVVNQRQLESIAGQLEKMAVKDREQVETYKSADSRVKRFFDNLLFFLDLIGIFTVLLAGIGIHSALSALLKGQEQTIAIMKAVGAGSGFIMRHYFTLVAILGLAGTLLGIGVSFLLQEFLPGLFSGLLPASVELTVVWGAVAEGFVIGSLVVALFTALPLYRLKEIKPGAIFGKKQQGVIRDRSTWLAAAVLLLFFIVMVFLRIREFKTGLYFILGVGGLIVIAFLCTEALLWLLRKRHTKNLILRQALRGLFRPGNATRQIMVTLTAALAVIFLITIVEKNLNADFVESYPPNAPNMYFIDIQPDQKAAFAKSLGIDTMYYPVVRGTIIAVNGESNDQEMERTKRGDNLAREFNLTYRQQLLTDEQIIEGKTLFRKDWPGLQVSVLDTVIRMRKMQVGDTITFRIQGMPVEARISSIRTRTRGALQPYFYFVFPDEVLKDAPQTFFAAVTVDKHQIAAIQNRIIRIFPNISVIDLTEAIKVFSRVMEKLSSIVRFFTLFSVVAGILIIISSIFATRYARIQEAVYFTVLGAGKRFVMAVFAVENLAIGLSSGVLAIMLAQTGNYIVCVQLLEITCRPFAGASLLMVLSTVLVVIAVGSGASVSVFRQKPAAFLRERTEE